MPELTAGGIWLGWLLAGPIVSLIGYTLMTGPILWHSRRGNYAPLLVMAQ